MYAIGVTSRLSGVPAETIRIWERRYGLPCPERSAGGHRLYSDGDVELLRAIKHLVDQGVRPGSLHGMSQDEILRLAFGAAKAEPPREDEDLEFDALIAEAIGLARDLDAEHLAELLGRPLLHRHAHAVVLRFYLPLLHEVGELWHAGELSVASEHLVEKLVSGRIHTVLANRSSAPADAPVAVCACVAGERHEVGLLAATVLLHDVGLRVVYLGADLPARDLVEAARQTRPRLVVLATYTPLSDEDQAALRAAVLDPALSRVAFALGGGNAEALAAALPVQATVCRDVDVVAAMARAMLQAS